MNKLGRNVIVLTLGALMCFAVCLISGCSSEVYTYVPTMKQAQLTTPSIATEGVLHVGVNTNNPPLAGQSSKIIGFDVDLAAALSDELGLKVEIVDIGSDAYGALQDGSVDIAMGIDKSYSNDALWISDPYLESGVALFSSIPNAAVPSPSSGASYAAQASSASAWALDTVFGASSVQTTSDLVSAFTLLENGEVQYAAADAVIGTYVAHAEDMRAYIVAVLQEMSGYCVATLKTNDELKESVSAALQTLINGGIVSVIERKWLGTSLDLDEIPLVSEPASEASAAVVSISTSDGSDEDIDIDVLEDSLDEDEEDEADGYSDDSDDQSSQGTEETDTDE